MPRSRPVPESVVSALKQQLGEGLLDHQEVMGQTRITIERGKVIDTLRFLKSFEECPFEQLSDISGADMCELPGYDEDAALRFAVFYVLTSMSQHYQIVLRTLLPEDDPVVASAFPVYRTAVWTEREAYEMFGIRFEGHPDLRRLLTPDYFDEDEQYPLRKDYPLRGHGDRYNFPVYDPKGDLDLSRFGYTGGGH